ncbi:hypothetical protein TNCV_2523591 [Trichonephila clavipes]|nr:hypothetical protein TNCV_2523591 [Trichonephila clavipes]
MSYDEVYRHVCQKTRYRGVEDWPPYSPDLTPKDFLLLEYLKQLVYATPPQTMQELLGRIEDDWANGFRSMSQCVQKDIQTRIQTCIAQTYIV